VEFVANFLSSLFQRGYEYRTINNYRSAISAFHSGVAGQKMGQQTLIKQVMKGVFNSRPPLPRYNETWDVDKVLKHLENMGGNQNLSLKELTFKTLALMALTSASRVSELQKLDIRFMNVLSDEIVFTITQLTKTRKANNMPLKVIFPKLDRDRLDVYSCILEYMKRTEHLRGEEHQYFISHTKPHKGVKSCTLAGWLKSTIKLAGIDTSVFKAHSTRGASTSKAFKFGMSLGQIMSMANWKSAGTFNRFYNKPVSSEGGFADKILTIAPEGQK
jgi:site-specific recombinase XerD